MNHKIRARITRAQIMEGRPRGCQLLPENCGESAPKKKKKKENSFDVIFDGQKPEPRSQIKPKGILTKVIFLASTVFQILLARGPLFIVKTCQRSPFHSQNFL